MLCRSCRRQTSRATVRCRSCGTPIHPGGGHLDLVLPDGRRVAVHGAMRLGRGAANDVRLTDPSVSREHARIVALPGGGVALEDAASSHGTRIDGRPLVGRARLHEDMRIGLGDCELVVEERRDPAAAGRTVSIPLGVSVVVPAAGTSRAESRVQATGAYPRLRSGWSLKRLEAAEGPHRFVLKDHRAGVFLRLGGAEAELLAQLDGRHPLEELVLQAEAACGHDGTARLARLLADLADHDMLSGAGEARVASSSQGRLARMMRPREHLAPRAGELFAAAYRRGGFLLVSRPAVAPLALVAVAGLSTFAVLVAGRSVTPFVVARHVGLGALVFVCGRLMLVAFHELAHGLVCESFGRRVARAGIKTVLVLPYAFVDTSDAWFEPRRRRIAVSLAGPASDLVLGGACAIACAVTPGSARDILFQLALAGYVGALFNLNPLLDRDGYHVVADLLGQPSLRSRARLEMRDVLAGRRRAPATETRALILYGVASLVWAVGTVGFAIAISLRYYHRLVGLAPTALVWTLLASFYLVLVLPLGLQIGRPLWERARTAPPLEGGQVDA